MFARGGWRFLTALFVICLATGISEAGWVTLRNDSSRTLIVQEMTKAPDGTVTRGRPTRLLPGETLREFRAGPMMKTIEVYDMQAPTKPLFSGRLIWNNDNQ